MAITGKMMMIDMSKCIACKACQIACQQWHSLPAEDTEFTGSYQNPPDMSGANLTIVKFSTYDTPVSGYQKWLFFKDQCRHCDPPPCQGACLWGAIKQKPNGMVYIDPDICDPNICTGGKPYLTRPCESACPYSIPKWKYIKDGKEQGLKEMKCDFCYDRFPNTTLKNPPYKGTFGRSNRPACEVVCPVKAIKTGKADKMLKKARRRRRWLRNHGFPDANLYRRAPSKPLTHVVWVLTEDKSKYGL